MILKPRTQDLVLTLNTKNIIDSDNLVRLVDCFIDKLRIRKVLNSLYLKGRNPAIEPKIMLKTIIFAYMKCIYSSRKIASACKYNIEFIWLLRGRRAPTHNTICRFIKKISPHLKYILSKFVDFLFSIKEINFENLFIDGTKIEAYANKYSFVWKKSVDKFQKALIEKINLMFLLYGIQTEENHLEYLQIIKTYLYQRLADLHINIVHGKGKHKSVFQKELEEVNNFIEKLLKYNTYQKLFSGRNSFSKTDVDATFMRMKEDHMRNGQLKPAYNIQIGVEAEYIVNVLVRNDRSDVNTLIPLLEDFPITQKYKNIVADAGYESLENYTYLSKQGYNSFIKPLNYEKSKKRKYKNFVGKVENMQYNAGENEYICINNVKLKYTRSFKRKTLNKFSYLVDVYESEDCTGCKYINECKKTSKNKVLHISTDFYKFRSISLNNIKSQKGIILRINRSIQAEGAFAKIKESRMFRRFTYRGFEGVTAQTIFLVLAFNILNYASKKNLNRLGESLYQ